MLIDKYLLRFILSPDTQHGECKVNKIHRYNHQVYEIDKIP